MSTARWDLLHSRFAAWADRNVNSGILTILLAADLLVGLNFLAFPDSAFTSPVYRVAREVMPLPWWGWTFLAVTGAAVVFRLTCGRCFTTAYVCGPLLAGLWAWWLVLFVLGPTAVDPHAPTGAVVHGPTASLLAAVFALTLCSLHALAGLSLIAARDQHPPG